MKRFFSVLFAIAIILVNTTESHSQTRGIQHSFFVAGPEFTGIVGEDGKESWDSGRGGARDGWVLPGGNVLIAWSDIVREFTRDKNVVFEYKLDPTNREIGTIERFEHGNTLVCLTNGNKVVELDADGKVLWKVGNDDLPGDPIDDACGGQRLPNGNTVITSYHARVGVKLLEVTPEKKIVWTYEGPHRAHHFQILTTNGEPVAGKPLR
jgi:hypothetical protein